MNPIKLYFDEDAMHSRLVTALRSRGVTVVTVMDAGLTEKADEEQLAFATERECVLYTFNVSDFYRLHTQWAGAGREHAGMILAPATAILGRRAIAPHLASSRDHNRREYAESGRVPRQLGLTTGALVSTSANHG